MPPPTVRPTVDSAPPAAPGRALKAVSLEFRDVSSRALRSDEESAQGNLRRLLAFVRRTPLLADAVAAVPPPAEPIEAQWARIRDHGGPQATGRLPLPEDPAEELGLLHAAVDFLAGAPHTMRGLALGYGGNFKTSEAVEDLLDHVVGTYVASLNRVIELALLDANDPAYGPARGLSITVSGGTNQFAVAQDTARVEATQQIDQRTGTDAAALLAQLADAVGAFRTAAEGAGVDPAVRTDALELADAVEVEVQRPAPSRYTLRRAREHLGDLAAGGKSIGELAAQAGPLAALLGDLVHRLAP